jgi:hypothetical protein
MDQKMYSGEGIHPPSPFPPLHFSNVLLVSLEVRHDLGKDLHPQVAFRGAAEFQINTAPALKVDGQAHGVVDVVRHALNPFRCPTFHVGHVRKRRLFVAPFLRVVLRHVDRQRVQIHPNKARLIRRFARKLLIHKGAAENGTRRIHFLLDRRNELAPRRAGKRAALATRRNRCVPTRRAVLRTTVAAEEVPHRI